MSLFGRGPDPFDPRLWEESAEEDGGKPRKRRRWIKWIALSLALLLVGGAAYGYWLYKRLQEEITDTELAELVDPPESDAEPFNALLIGSDSREGLTAEEQLDLGAAAVSGERADTLILAHIDPETDKVIMVQFPRDLFVPVAGGSEDRVNASLVGGNKDVVKTIEALTGLSINRYAKVDIAGFIDIVDAVDGVDVCVPEVIEFDDATGLAVPEPGMIHFDGEAALRFVRSRKVFATGDFARIQNQQKFLAAALNKVTSIGSLLNLARIQSVLGAVGDHVRVDPGTSPLDLLDLGQQLRNFTPENYEAYIAPHLGISNVDGMSVILPDLDAMEVMFEALENNESPAEADGVPDIDPASVRVAVVNGTETPGAAPGAATALTDATAIEGGPVEIVHIDDEPTKGFTRTTVVHAPGADEEGELVAAAIPGAVVQEGDVAPDVEVEVVVHDNFMTKRLVKLVPIPIPEPTTAPAVCRQEGRLG